MVSGISYSHAVPRVNKYRYPVSAWRCMSLRLVGGSEISDELEKKVG